MNDSQSSARLRQNWQRVEEDVRAAAQQCGRRGEEITIIGVSKYVDAATTRTLAEAGCRQLGESRPQSLWQKAEALSDIPGLRWHLIGHLQRNKARRLILHRPVIHSVDSIRLLRTIDQHSAAQDCVTDVLLEVNISGDQAKTGFTPDGINEAIKCWQELQQTDAPGVQVLGLMAMAGWGTDRDQARRQFDQVAQLRADVQSRSGVALPELSMGMSGDFREAIAAGSTMVRIGTRLFEGVSDRS